MRQLWCDKCNRFEREDDSSQTYTNFIIHGICIKLLLTQTSHDWLIEPILEMLPHIKILAPRQPEIYKKTERAGLVVQLQRVISVSESLSVGRLECWYEQEGQPVTLNTSVTSSHIWVSIKSNNTTKHLLNHWAPG